MRSSHSLHLLLVLSALDALSFLQILKFVVVYRFPGVWGLYSKKTLVRRRRQPNDLFQCGSTVIFAMNVNTNSLVNRYKLSLPARFRPSCVLLRQMGMVPSVSMHFRTRDELSEYQAETLSKVKNDETARESSYETGREVVFDCAKDTHGCVR